MEEDEKRMVIGTDDYNKEILITQFKSILQYLENAEDILQILDEKPFVCGNRTVLEYPRVLDIQVKIKLVNLED